MFVLAGVILPPEDKLALYDKWLERVDRLKTIERSELKALNGTLNFGAFLRFEGSSTVISRSFGEICGKSKFNPGYDSIVKSFDSKVSMDTASYQGHRRSRFGRKLLLVRRRVSAGSGLV